MSEPPPVSLATLQRDGIQFDTSEAVAIGQALCLALITAQSRRRHDAEVDGAGVVRPLNTETVLIDPASRLGVSADDPGDEAIAIHYVGRILSDIVPGVARRKMEAKIIAKALASPPQFGGIAELSHALAKFEKAQGRALIQAVYERWQNGDVAAEARSQASPSPDFRLTSRIRLGSPPKAVAAALIVVAVLMVGISATFLITRSYAEESVTDPGDSAESAPLLESRSIAPLTADLVAWSVARAERPALPMPVSPVKRDQLPPRVAASPIVARVERPVPTRSSRSGPRAEASKGLDSPMPRPTNDLQPTPPQVAVRAAAEPTSVSGTSDVIRARNEVAPAISSPPIEPVETVRAGSRPVRDRFAPAAIYTASDVDVVPPTPVLPRLVAGLRPSSPGIRLDALAISVVVDELGRAHSVNGVNTPQNVGEFLLLTSALAVVKSWEFEPASKDGVPVRYRLVVPLRRVTRQDP